MRLLMLCLLGAKSKTNYLLVETENGKDISEEILLKERKQF